MSNTQTLKLPLVQASQAQKHVTVNEALVRIDALARPVLKSRSLATPPPLPDEGDTYGVPTGATGSWTGQDGTLAIYLNGGWDFVTPSVGWSGWIADEGVPAIHDGVEWIASAGAVSPGGAASALRVVEIDHAVGAGATSETAAVIPAQSLVLGVTGRVTAPLGGTLSSWRLGIGGVSDDRYGSGLGLSSGSWVRGLTSTPLAYYDDTALTLTGEGGAFASGTVRLAVHLIELRLPRA